MFGRRWLEVFVVAVVLVKVIHVEGGEVSPLQELGQEDAETILATQTTLRRYLIESLTDLREKISPSHALYSVAERVLQLLRTRDLDPLTLFREGYNAEGNRSGASHLATVFYSLQGCTPHETTSLAAWHAITSALPPPPPDLLLPPPHLNISNTPDTPYPHIILLALHHHHLSLTPPLLLHILYNYPFPNYSPDLETTLTCLIHSLNTSQHLLRTFRPNPSSTQPNQILSDILKFLLPHHHHPSHLHLAHLLSQLSTSNVARLTPPPSPWQLFLLINQPDYPPDIATAATDLAAALRSNELTLDTTTFRGYSPLETLLAVTYQLTLLPPRDPLSGKVHAIYPHVKLRYLSTKETFFRPRSPSDIAFLLNSFLTAPPAPLIQQIHQTFLHPNLNPLTLLDNLNYSRYSSPRPLLLAILHHLLLIPDKLPLCYRILFTNFLQNATQIPTCAPPHQPHQEPIRTGSNPKPPVIPLTASYLPEETTTTQPPPPSTPSQHTKHLTTLPPENPFPPTTDATSSPPTYSFPPSDTTPLSPPTTHVPTSPSPSSLDSPSPTSPSFPSPPTTPTPTI